MACRIYKNHYNDKNDETNLYVYKFDYEISKTANEITKIPGTVKKLVFIYRSKSLCSSESFLIFGDPSTNFVIN